MSDIAINPASPNKEVTFRQVLVDAWRLIKPFWQDKAERRAWGLLFAVVGLTLLTVWLNVQFSNWNNSFYNTLQDKDLNAFWHQLGIFCILAAAFIVSAVYRQYLQQILFMRWRAWLNRHMIADWMQSGTPYRMGVTNPAVRVDNPDQRISEDARDFVSATLDLSLGFLNASVTLVSFIHILWVLSGTLTIPLGGSSIAIPGYMVWVALTYSLLGSWFAHLLGRPLVSLNWQQQQVEADFRFALTQIREYAESIALSRGEGREKTRLMDNFSAVLANWSRLIRVTKRYTWFSSGYGQIAIIFPILAAAPRFFSGAIHLGGLMQTAQAFGQVQGALSWFIDAYPSLASWRATVLRLTTFANAIKADQQEMVQEHVQIKTQIDNAVDLNALHVCAPDGHAIIDVPAYQFNAHERVLIIGPSGGGKSSLIRTIAGLWRKGQGVIKLPAKAMMMFLPQRPYLPAGSLKEALAYPQDPSTFSDDQMVAAMKDAELAHYVAHLNTAHRWSAILSPGEQQRIHFARVFLHRPDWIFLDESTSALDESTEKALYEKLYQLCPESSIVSVGHRSTLKTLHQHIWSITNQSLAAEN